MIVVRKIISSIDNQDRKKIDYFIEANHGLVFHDTEFNRIVSESFDTELSYFIAFNNKHHIIGICPIHTVRKGWVRQSYSNPAIFEVPYGGWVFDPQQVSIETLLMKTKISFNESLTYWSSIQIEENQYSHFKEKNSGEARHTAVIDLTQSEDAIWETVINSKRRNMIRKAIKSGIKIKMVGPEGFEFYYSLMKDMHKKIKKNLKPKKYYSDIFKYLFETDQAVILIAEKDDEVLSGLILIGNRYVMHYWQGASKTGMPNLGQGELLQWDAIKWSKRCGCYYYDLCVIEKERLPDIAKFKLGFSKNIVPFYLIQKKSGPFRLLSKLQRSLILKPLSR